MRKDTEHMRDVMNTISANVKVLMERRNIHTGIITGIIDSLKSLTYLKVFIILLISILQIYLIQKFFGSGSQVKVGEGGSVYL
jgi:hypothetical protein